MVELELATNKELIDQLIARHNFVGVVVYSTKEHVEEGQIHHTFAISARGGDRRAISTLLKKMAKQLMEENTNDTGHCEGA